MDRNERTVKAQTHTAQVEVVKQDRQVVVKAAAGREADL